MSKLPRSVTPPTRTRLVKRRSNWLSRFSKYDVGSRSSRFMLALQVAAPRHCARSRPSDVRTTALAVGFVAVTGIPGMFWNVALVWRSQGNGYTTRNFTWVPADHGRTLRQLSPEVHEVAPPAPCVIVSIPCSASGTLAVTSHASYTVRPTLRPPENWPRCANRVVRVRSIPLKTSLRLP